jgi:WD40 repeat protein
VHLTSFSGNYCASGDETGLVRIWDITQVQHIASPLQTVTFPQPTHILKFELPALSGKSSRVPAPPLPSHAAGTVTDIAWSPDSQRIVAVGAQPPPTPSSFFPQLERAAAVAY